MMADDLKDLLASYEFLNRSLEDYEERLMPAVRDQMASERDRVFLDILSKRSQEQAVTVAQLSFIVDALRHLAGDSSQAKLLHSICRRHLETLMDGEAPALDSGADQFERWLQGAASRPDERFAELTVANLTVLDSYSDRVSIMSADYEYRYTNPANAHYHRASTDDIVGTSASRLVGDKCFVAVTKPTIDSCFAGRSFRCYVGHRQGLPRNIYSVSGDPIRGDNGRIVGALLVARDITDAPPRGHEIHRVIGLE